jgi:hypothetical protein
MNPMYIYHMAKEIFSTYSKQVGDVKAHYIFSLDNNNSTLKIFLEFIYAPIGLKT